MNNGSNSAILRDIAGALWEQAVPVPPYQRFYSWHPAQRYDLFSDLLKLAIQEDTEVHHFMATLVCHKTAQRETVGVNEFRVYDIVDGQQRITTLIILLKCIELSLPIQSDHRIELARTLVKGDGRLILLQTNNANDRLFNRFIREGVRPTDNDLQTYADRALKEAIDECSVFVNEWDQNLPSLISLILHRLGFVIYDADDNRTVYTVFEVLNSRGLDVDWLDKSKSVLMGRAFELAPARNAAEEELQTLQNTWQEIYREIAKRNIQGEEVLRVAATIFYGPIVGKPRSSEDSLELLREQCNTFDMPRRISERLLDIAKKLTWLDSSIYLGPVTDIFHARILAIAIRSVNSVSDAERQQLMDQWERTTFRVYNLGRNDSRVKVGDYVRLAGRIGSEDIDTRTYNQILAGLRAIGETYEIERVCNTGLANTDCYDESPEMCRYVLWQYEEHLAAVVGAGAIADEAARAEIWRRRTTDSIEHIFPQNPGRVAAWQGRMRRTGGTDEEVWRHVGRIGNLLLLPIAMNQEAGNIPFQEKKDVYRGHNLRMMQEVCQEQDWTLDQIESREARIVEWAKSRWADI